VPRTAPKRPKRYPLTAFPAPFRNELERYLAWLADPQGGVERVCQPSTLKQRRVELKGAASVLAEAWGGPERVSALGVLVEPANARVILQGFLRRAPRGEPTEFVRSLTRNLVALARDWVKVPAEQLAELRGLQAKNGNPPPSLAPSSRLLLHELADPKLKAALLSLPATLADHARSERKAPVRQRLLLRTALAIELLLHTGMRLHQLATLRVGRDLSWPHGRQAPARLIAPGVRARDGAPQEFELSGAPQALLDDYLDRFAAKVDARSPHPPLFVNADQTPVTPFALADGIEKATLRHLGVRIRPRDFRHICAQLILDVDAGDYTTVKDLLGHRYLITTHALYGGRENEEAVGEWHRLLASDRAQLTMQRTRHGQA
jgi:integrase